MKRLYRKCPICENEYGKVLKNIKMELPENVKIPKEYEVVCCSKCGFTYADVDASQKDYNDYYEFNNVYSKNATIKFVGIHKRHILCCEFLEEYIKKNDRILDVGCGSGELLRTLKDRGFSNLVGLDPSEESIAILNQYGIEGIKQNIFDVIPNDLKNQFHVVISTVVLEHIYDVNLFVKQMVDYLMPGGVLYILVPAVEGFEIQCSQIPDYFNQEHINYFSLQSTDNLFGKYGFIRKSSNDKSLIRLGSDDLMVNAVYSYAERPMDRTMNIIKDEKSAKSILNYRNYSEPL